jgi:hypothetical protein
MNDWSYEETVDPFYADDRNFGLHKTNGRKEEAMGKAARNERL